MLVVVFTFLENALNLCIFTHASVLQSKLQVELYFLPQDERGGGNYVALSKFDQKM